MMPFDPNTVPLTGTHLVEASAGTGKTHSITALCARLVAEAGVTIDQIAVVTFTDAATRELRQRLRERLHHLHDALSGGELPPNDEQLATLVERCRVDADTHDAATKRVGTALLDLDDATVSTIHGFCARMLREFAFEAGTGFVEIEPTDSRTLRERLLQDFWRRAIIAGEDEDAAWVRTWCADPQALDRLLAEALRVAAVQVDPAYDPQQTAACLAELAKARDLGLSLLDAGVLITAFSELTSTKALSRDKSKSPYAPLALDSHRDALEAWLQGADLRTPPWHSLEILTPSSQDEFRLPRYKGAWPVVAAPVADWAQMALATSNQWLAVRRCDFLQRALHAVRAGLAIDKRDRGVASYDDLIADLASALHGPRGDALASAIRARFRVALVDEFQDTDAAQYSIFRKIFHREPGCALFLIGDPKQAIYRFRGGDVFAYRRAAIDAADQGWTLGRNWRSDERLIEAVNALFDPRRVPHPFVHEFIGFAPATRAEALAGKRTEPWSVDAPLTIWHPPDMWSKEALVETVTQATVTEARALLAAAHTGAPRLTLAVLVRDRYQGKRVVQAMIAAGVSASYVADDSVFDGREARELLGLLHALADPGNARLLRGALASELLGFNAAQIADLANDTAAWDREVERFAQWRALWQRGGIATVIATIARTAAERLLRQTDGERRLTDLGQLGELLQQAATEHAGAGDLVVWLTRRIAESSEGPVDAHKRRPSSDDPQVTVMTVHKSKGLQFDIVFAPFLWDGKLDPRADLAVAPEQRPPVKYHDAEGELRVDLGSRDWTGHAQQHRDEAFAESLRLTYVALTRARYRCYAVWARVGKNQPISGLSSFAWLLHRPDGAGVGGLPEHAALADDVLALRLGALAANSHGAITIQALPSAEARLPLQAPPPPILAAREFLGRIDRRYQMLSFSALFAHDLGDETPDHDQLALPAPEVVDDGEVPMSPRGPVFGECVHGILQHLDSARIDEPEAYAIIADACRRYGYTDEAQAIVERMVRAAVTVPIVAGASLTQIPASQRKAELEFFFPVRDLRLNAFVGALQDAVAHRRSGNEFARLQPQLQGMMHGYMDLVFEHEGRWYVLDYKTNALGSRYQDYAPAMLARAMREQAYDLQYLIYLVALQRHLRHRLGAQYQYDRHMGGAIYLFLRGLRSDSEDGIYRDRPPQHLIDALDAAFGPATEVAA